MHADNKLNNKKEIMPYPYVWGINSPALRITAALLPISMPTLKTQNGEPLKDAAGNEIKAGQTVTDSMFGDGIAEGTVALEKGPGCNVTIDWLGPNTSGKPKSRGTEFLTVKFASGGGGTTTRIHTGAEYESGVVFEQRGRNDADAGERCVGEGWGSK